MPVQDVWRSTEWLVPWAECFDDRDTCLALKRELKAELWIRHPLYKFRRTLRLVARRQDCDDALFWLGEKTDFYAVVHLTWSGQAERFRDCPTTKIYRSFEGFVQEDMIPENQNWFLADGD